MTRRYRDVLRGAFDVTPAVNPGLNLVVTSGGRARILVVGGGGSGGTYPVSGICGGGGGAGEMYESDVILPEGTLQVNVGSGGGLIVANWPGNVYSLSGGGATFIGDFAACGGGYVVAAMWVTVYKVVTVALVEVPVAVLSTVSPCKVLCLDDQQAVTKGETIKLGNLLRSGGGGGAGGPGLGTQAAI